MGAVKTDTNANERALESRYMALDNADGVRRLLRDVHALHERQYAGDYDAVVLLADLETAIERAGLTERQRQALALVYGADMTQEKAGEQLGISREAVKIYVESATKKIAEVYEAWAWMGEGYRRQTNEY